jgi:hypothetical protein
LGIARWPAFRSLTAWIWGLGVRQPAAEKKIKIQKAKGKWQRANGKPFEICPLQFAT